MTKYRPSSAAAGQVIQYKVSSRRGTMGDIQGNKSLPKIIECVNGGDVSAIKSLLLKGQVKVNDTDSSGMTALHHAAYKGNADLCKMLLSHGADVNMDSHDHRYSALHFAALSGNTDTVQHLLTAGARTYHTNTLGRTATQMAAFVGNHAVVALINNYLPLEEVLQHTTPAGLETEAKLPPSAAQPIYDLIMQINLHPVKIALLLENSKELRSNITKAWKLLEYMCEKETKRPENVNEVIAMKFHYLAYVLKTLEKELSKMDESADAEAKEKGTSIFESIVRKWLRGRPSDGFEEHLEYFIRDAIKSFPYVEIPLFIQLVRNITSSTVGETSALCILSGCINGQRAFQDEKACSTCGQEQKNLRKCSKCKMAQYCNRLCQKLHWTIHKKFCDKLLIEYQKLEKRREEERMREEEEKKREEEEKKRKEENAEEEEKQRKNEINAEVRDVSEVSSNNDIGAEVLTTKVKEVSIS